MRRTWIAIGGALAAAALWTAASGTVAHAQDGATSQKKGGSPHILAFRNTVDIPPRGAKQTFKLSADYPTSLPEDCKTCKWLNMPVSFQTAFPPAASGDAWTVGKWDQYIASILSYVREGQDPNLRDEIGFQAKVGGRTRWFNVPWMAYDPTVGREYRHGTTNERTAQLSELIGPASSVKGSTHFLPKMNESCKTRFPAGFETWSVGYYNEFGGYAVGKTIPKDGVPRVAEYDGSQMPAGLPFAEGTVVVKILTTNAPVDCVPYLKGSPEWQVNRHVYDSKAQRYSCQRKVQTSRVVQIDVAVTDARSPTGWVYGTYAYNGDRDGATFWDRLAPLGVQWGADPWTYPAVPKDSSLPLQQSVANPNVGIYQHMGCEGRLAGPVDNPQSSCMSCHGAAYTAKVGTILTMGGNVPPAFGFAGLCQVYSADNSDYFQNRLPPQSYSGKFANLMSLDTSLQLEVAFGQYGQYATDGAPQPCND